MTGTGRAGVRLTARGAIVMLFVITLVGMPFLPGPAFVAGCIAAVLLVRPRDLLPLVVTPPLVFFVAALLVELMRALSSGSMLQTFGLGMFTALSSGAPWLFLGSALALGVGWVRGLPDSLRELRGAPAPTPTPASRSRRGRVRTFDPEPEGYFEPRVYGKAADE
ncbi:DUF6542 domain-containing protein [Microbispora bryophytorum]|uniref:DUF6542 domain-containing protein n=1 Tax=Microbispora bryophytorum TaxID=1460882 RepID=A0A8H9H185_9ACTN|nr:DUF6542 domain-containing protein [Microbispora bryophytorum]MBD3136658.1 hypothetical protein [Microbispora bryophytorum]TQS06247.1 hypothetical protein FLX07_14425 [Microbispora bryophytorum]GGO17758.1 hypothetical protein GCM10011574_41770 [Microbispora bryophytorum]